MNEPLTKEDREELKKTDTLCACCLQASKNYERYEATTQDLERTLADAKERLAGHETALWILKDQVLEQTAAVGALAGALKQSWSYIEHVTACYSRQREGLDCTCEVGPILRRVHEALAPDAVQKTLEAWKGKDAEIEQLKPSYICAECSSSIIPDAVGSAFKCGYCGAISVGEMLWRTVSLLQLKGVLMAHAREANSAEAKLAVAMGLLAKVHGLDCRFCGQLMRLGHKPDCEYAAFLADPSQAAAQYQRAVQVVERVRAKLDIIANERADEGNLSLRVGFEGFLKEMLGDAAQDESPLDPSAGEDAVIERLREMEEQP